ncbi:hypothetical protein HY522_06065 [bacterium]|nr:hypothetical protein [bacterium]
MVIAVEDNERQADVLEDQRTGIRFSREEMFNASAELAACGRSRLLRSALSEREHSLVGQTQVLTDTLRNVAGILADVQRERQTSREPEPVVLELQ